MADSRKLTGYSWHSEVLKKDEFDDRRDKRRCVYFIRNDSKKGYCNGGLIKCIGSSHCSYYKEKSENTFVDKNIPKIIRPLPKKEEQKIIDLKMGDIISHKKFGVGTVTAIKNDVLTVKFKNLEYGEKKLKYGHAPIEKI